MNKYTDLETSNQLKEWGCDLESEQSYFEKFVDTGKGLKSIGIKFWKNKTIGRDVYSGKEDYPAYDLLWDVCVKHAKEFFGEEYDGKVALEHSANIFFLLRKDKIKEANEYLINSTIYNPKNK